jgi:phospholipase C
MYICHAPIIERYITCPPLRVHFIMRYAASLALLALALAHSALAVATYSVTQVTTTVVTGGNTVENFAITGGTTASTDWIGVYLVGRCGTTVGSTCPSGSNAWAYVPAAGMTSGSTSIAVSIAVGSYRQYYFTGVAAPYTIKAIGAVFTITAATTVNIVTNKVVGTGSFVSATFPVGSGAQWIGLYVVGAPADATHPALWWQNTAGLTSVVTSTTTNHVAWQTPAGVSPLYEWRTFADAGYTVTAKSNAIATVQCRAGNTPQSTVQHLIFFSTENHSFDSYFARVCTAPAGSNPTCTTGWACCETMPTNIGTIVSLTDAQNAAFDPCHSGACETCEMNGGLMDKYRSGCSGSSNNNIAAAPATGTLDQHFAWAAQGSIADHYFQSASGASSENDMYLAYARGKFDDNAWVPNSAKGVQCYGASSKKNFDDTPTVLDLVDFCGVSWGVYPEQYNNAACYPNGYDASDIGASYSSTIADRAGHYKDSSALLTDISGGTLPAVSFVRSIGTHSEHPGNANSFATSQSFIKQFVDAIGASVAYKPNTVLCWSPDESGGFADHVAPPAGANPIDGQLWGPRKPLICVGDQVRVGGVAHTVLEDSSFIEFIEWNFLGNGVGQLGARDTITNNIGSLFDPAKTGVTIPSV